ncbi:hypothetical protein V8E54_010538 [Elaphomyces granulatus]
MASESSNQRVFCSQCAKPWQSARYKTCDDCRKKVAERRVQKRRRSPSTENVGNRRRRVTEEALAGLEVQPRPRGRPRKHTEEALAGLEVQPRPRGPPRKYAEEAQKCSRNYVGSLGR